MTRPFPPGPTARRSLFGLVLPALLLGRLGCVSTSPLWHIDATRPLDGEEYRELGDADGRSCTEIGQVASEAPAPFAFLTDGRRP